MYLKILPGYFTKNINKERKAMKISHIKYLSPFLIFIIIGCGAGWLKPLTPDQMSAYPNIFALAKDRYTSMQASLGMVKFRERTIEDRKVGTFYIASNKTVEDSSLSVLINDMENYCSYKGGNFSDIRQENIKLMQELRKKHSYQIEKTNLRGVALFECGPSGHGTVSDDWTRFDSTNCRKLYTTRVDSKKFNRDFGNPPDFVCMCDQGAFFNTRVVREAKGNVVTFYVRLNKDAGGKLISKSSMKTIK